MRILVNGKNKEIAEENIPIEGLLVQLEVESPDMVSVQLNGEIINREEYKTRRVKNEDEVEFLYFMGGGSY